MSLLSEYLNISETTYDNNVDQNKCISCGFIMTFDKYCSKCGVICNNNQIKKSTINKNNSYKELQREQIFVFIKKHNNDTIKLSDAVIETAVNIYRLLQSVGYKNRSEFRKEIVAGCIKLACIANNTMYTNNEIAKFMQLQKKGISRGENYIRIADINKKININQIYNNVQIAWIKTLLKKLSMPDIFFDVIRDMINIMDEKGIGSTSMIDTRIIGCVYYFQIHIGQKMGFNYICTCCNIKKSTILKIINNIASYIYIFDAVYEKHSV
jgi:transcription initiation factor TFIIIB Brf1 subunit/transcription initiation factor TFIIB